MPSPADHPPRPGRWRAPAEWTARVASLGLIALAARGALQPARTAAEPTALRGGDVTGAMASWVAAGGPESVRLALDSVPLPDARAALRALARSGTRLAWRGDSLVPVAVAASPVPHPRGGTRVAVAAPRHATVAIGDGVATLDTVRLAGVGTTLTARGALSGVTAGVRGTARAAAPDSVAIGRILVVGAAGWESKFAIAALEEDGWSVDARLAVAPGVTVTQGAAVAVDTASYAAVVVLDSTGGPPTAGIARFVRSGGGLVLAGTAVRAPALAALAPAALGAATPGTPTALATASASRGLTLAPLARLAPAAVVLEREPRGPAVAAWRLGLGRVVQAGYTDSWRWRMEGGADAAAAHRAWWSGLVSAVARAPEIARSGCTEARCATALPVDPAPYAALVESLGQPDSAAAAPTVLDTPPMPWFGWPAFLSVIVLLLSEWGSRRARGAR